MRYGTMAAFLAAGLFTTNLAAKEKLPPKAAAAIKKAFPEGKIEEVEKEVEGDKVVYEVEVEVGDKEYDVTVTGAGEILEIEREIKVADLPKAVSAGVLKKYPGATIKEAEEILDGDKVSAYEVAVVTKDKKEVEALFGPNGKFMKGEKDDDDKDDDKDDDDDDDDKDDED